MYTIKQGSKTVGFRYDKRHFIIGFNNPIVARKVQYGLHPEPKFTLVPDTKIDLSPDVDLLLDTKATLFIPKFEGSPSDPMNDGMFHLNKMSSVDFLSLPLISNVGVIMPYRLEEESSFEFIYKAQIIEPKN